MKLKPILIFIVVLGIVFFSCQYFKREKSSYIFELVKRGDVTQKISATGKVTPAKKLNLQFEISGKIQDIKVKVGQEVEKGDFLAVLDTSELETQVLEAKAARDVAKAKLDKILKGASEEEIRVYETAVENAKIALENAKISLKNAEQNLTDVKTKAENDLKQAYEDALNTLDDSYLKIYNALNTVDFLERTYFFTNEQGFLDVKESKNKIKKSMVQVKSYLDAAKSSYRDEDIDIALSEMRDALDTVYKALVVVREVCQKPVYRNRVPATDKTSLDTHKSSINSAYTNIVNAQQRISSIKLINESNIDTAQANLDAVQNAVKTAEGNLKSAQVKLDQIKAPPQETDVALAQAQLEQAESSLLKAKQQLTKANLIAPCCGIITDIKKEVGETVNSMIIDPVISMICKGKFQIEVDIPEADIAKINLEDPVEISLDAFPGEIFMGKVVKINPAETVIQGAVYYKVTVEFDKLDDRIKSGMTANIEIITERKKNVLLIPQRAILTKNGKEIVRVLEDGEVKEVEVKTGIEGNEDEIEILSGLKEGDKVITFIKKK
ncbi:efflux RND transporter periplasmic adaptor subunit [bacterium]|nr:efflux RND transporter periplasmic adaptor subunit [bacterium]